VTRPTLSDLGRARLLTSRGEPLFLAHWDRAVFLHFEVDPKILQPLIPVPLDLYNGRAFVSLVAFTMRDMRPRLGGRFAKALFKPISTHTFLNVRTYVMHRGELGIYFMTKWVPNKLAAFLGPRTFGLPYRLGDLDYHHHHEKGLLKAEVRTNGGHHDTDTPRLAYQAKIDPHTTYKPCTPDSLDALLLERYTAYTLRFGKLCYFRIWHPPWKQTRINAELSDTTLLDETVLPTRFISGHYTPGAQNVWMGRPHTAT
jgi:uncharacterized protein YqjF (DUF2071 family)